MADLKSLMEPYDASQVERVWCRALVYCPEYCESEYEICEVQAGKFIGQANGEDITQYVQDWTEIESYL